MQALLRKIRRILQDRRTRRFIARVVTSLAAIVVFVTTYALILPAITLEKTAVCGIEEHQHDDSCYEERLVCELEESDEHHHTEACYEKVLVCGKEVHTHSGKCYEEVDSINVNVEADSSDNTGDNTAGRLSDLSSAESSAEETGSIEPEMSDSNAAAEEAQPDSYVPELDSLDMETLLNSHSGFYYFHAGEGEEILADSAEIIDWKKVKEETTLAPTDLVRMYLAYTIPAGSLNETNPSARYRLPDSLHLSDEQIKAMNQYENGIAAGYRDSRSSSGKDEQDKEKGNYKKYLDYLGAEAVEGDRRPDELLKEGAQEFISAVVRAENVYDDKGNYLGQDLIFTFVPYSIEKNQDSYDADMTLISAGEEITGWFVCDFRLDQIDWEQDEDNREEDRIREDSFEEIASVIFAKEDQDKEIPEIRRVLRMTGGISEAGEIEEAGKIDGTSETEEAGKISETGEKEEAIETRDGASAGSGTDAQISTRVITADGSDYLITVTYGSEAEIPQGAELAVRELLPGTEEYDQHLQAVEEKIHSENSEDDSAALAARFFDITILSDGVEIQPSAPVDVRIELTEKIGEDLQVFHFDDEGDEVETLQTVQTLQTEEQAPETRDSMVQFSTESFSVFAIVGTVIEKNVLTSDGHNYKVTVTYGPETEIPEKADLAVEEITEDSSVYGTYVSGTENVLGMEEGSAGYMRLFDIKIVDKDDPGVKYQPAEGTRVEVRIELADAQDRKALSVVHFADEDDEGNVVDADVNGKNVSFEADGFSIYVVAEDNYTRLIYRFHDVDDSVISTQYVKKYIEPDTEQTVYEKLYDPGLVPEYGQRLVGWAYSADETDAAKIYQLSDLDNHTIQKMDAPGFVDETIVDVYAIMDEAWYLRYMDVDENGTVKILKTVRIPKDADNKQVDINYVAMLPDGTHYEGWYDPVESEKYSEHLYEGDHEIYDTIELNKHLDLYLKVDNRVWLVYDANAGGAGSGASYTPPQMLYTNTTPPQTTTKPEDPKWKGYTFTGWNTSPDGSGEDWLKVESRTFDEDGNLIDVQYSVNKFGEPLDDDVLLYAQWEPDDNFYRIAYWRQKETDAVDADDSEKKYDFYGYREISTNIKTGDVVSASANDQNMTWVAQHLGKTLGDENKFSFNENRSDTGTKTVAGDGSTVLNMYFDRAVMEFIFNQNFPGYTETEDISGDVYGYVDGQYVLLTKGDPVTTYTYTMQYTYTPSLLHENNRYGLVDGEYVALTRDSYVSIDGGQTAYTGRRYSVTTDNNGTQYGVVNGQVVQLTRQGSTGCGGSGYYWTYGNNQTYNGQRYRQDNNGSYGFGGGEMQTIETIYEYSYGGNTYTGTRYMRNNGGNVYTGIRYSGVNGAPVEDHTGTQYGIDSNGGFVPLNRESETDYSFSYKDSEDTVHQYQGTLYKQDMINTLRGLYGSQMKPGEWPTNYFWQFANYRANSYSSTNNRTTLNAAWTSYNISTNAYEYNRGTAPYTTWHLYSTNHSGNVNIVYWRQNADGNYVSDDAVRTTGANNGTLTIGNNKFYAFTMLGYEYGGTGGTPNSSGNTGDYGWHDLSNGVDTSLTMRSGYGDINIYYQRDKFNVTFQSNDADSTVRNYPDKVLYEKNLDFLKDWYTPEESDGKDGYYFVGWYSDANFTKPFDFENEEMPHNDLVLYGRWDTYRVRVVLVPTKANAHNDEVYFPNDQALSFRVDYNNTISDANINTTVAERTGYKLVGWYTTPDFRDGTEWSFDTQINSRVNAINMHYQQSEDWENNTYGDNDGKHDDVEGILKLYAKWQFDFNEDDLFIEYEVPETYVKRDALGNILTVIPQDTKKYTYSPSGTAISAQIENEPENYIDAFTFSKWELLDSANVETGTLFGANDTIDNSNINPYVQFREVQDDTGQTRTMKVIVLRATFTKNNNNKGTVVTFDGNGGCTADNASATRSLTIRVNEDFTIPGETGTNAFVREGYDLIGWSFDQTTTPEQFHEAVTQVGDSTPEERQELAKLGLFEINENVAADNLKLSDDNNWDPLENTIYAVWEPHRFTVKITKTVDGEEMSERAFSFATTGLRDEYSQFTLVNKESKSLAEIPYGTIFSLTETPFAGYTIQNVEAKQTSDANGVLLDTPINLQGQDGKEYEAKGNIEITYTNKATAVPLILKKVGYNNTDGSVEDYDLQGATFTVYTTEEGNEIAKDKNGVELKNLTSGADGVFFNGMLNTGTYYLYESVVPDGYYAPLGRFRLDVGQDSTTLTTTWDTGSPNASAGIVTESTDAGTGLKTYTVSIRNTAGIKLPSTGGRGTKNYYITGFLLIGLAIILLRRNRIVQ